MTDSIIAMGTTGGRQPGWFLEKQTGIREWRGGGVSKIKLGLRGKAILGVAVGI